MTVQLAPLELFTSGFVTMLRSTVGGGVRIFDENAYGNISYPFVVVHDLGGPSPTGPPLLGDGADVAVTYQVDSVGRKRSEAQELDRRCRTRVVQSNDAGGFLYPITVAGWRCAERRTDSLLGVNPEGKTPQDVFVARTRYVVRWTPA